MLAGCRFCGKTYNTRPAFLARRPSGGFCSRGCFSAYRASLKPHKPTSEERFWSRVDVRGRDECWEWQGCRYSTGYGKAYFPPRMNTHQYAHRAAYLITHGAIPDGLHICHHCDNPGCVNPEHLFAGTAADNIRDRDMKGRTAKGEQTGSWRRRSTLLTPDLVRTARLQYSVGEASMRDLAAIYGVSYATMHQAVSRYTWRWVE